METTALGLGILASALSIISVVASYFINRKVDAIRLSFRAPTSATAGDQSTINIYNVQASNVGLPSEASLDSSGGLDQPPDTVEEQG